MPATKKLPASYVPFKSFQTALEILEQALPTKIDRSVWPTFSYSLQTHMMSAFKFLELIGEDGTVQESLTRLVHEKNDRKARLALILRDRYPAVVALGDSNASPQQLQNAMRQYDVSGSMLDKAVRFFVQAAQWSGVPLSPLWSPQKRRGTSTAARKRQSARRVSPQDKKTKPPKDNGGGAAQVSTKTVELRTGGTVTLQVSINPITLSTEDRDFVFGMVDKLRAYEADGKDS